MLEKPGQEHMALVQNLDQAIKALKGAPEPQRNSKNLRKVVSELECTRQAILGASLSEIYTWYLNPENQKLAGRIYVENTLRVLGIIQD